MATFVLRSCFYLLCALPYKAAKPNCTGISIQLQYSRCPTTTAGYKRNVPMIRLTEEQTADFFAKACATIGQTPDKINHFYPKAAIHWLEYGTDSVLEITTEYATLSCLLDAETRCKQANVFINKEDELEVVMHILRYCTKTYRYSYLLKMWVNNGLGIDLQAMERSFLLSISRVMPLPDGL